LPWPGRLWPPASYLTVFIQAATRDGYSLSRVALSLLSLGNEGWIQITNFIVCGLLTLISVLGFRAVLASHQGGVWSPLLVAIYGLGLGRHAIRRCSSNSTTWFSRPLPTVSVMTKIWISKTHSAAADRARTH
jgi:hypothetical protein